MTKQMDDLVMGDLNEQLVEQIIIDTYNFKPNKTEPNHPMDFEYDDYYFEVKSRRNNYNQYPTTMIGYNKWRFAKTCGRKVVFIFSFLDGVYKYDYNELDNFENKIGGRCDRGRQEYKKYIYIPIEKLVRID